MGPTDTQASETNPPASTRRKILFGRLISVGACIVLLATSACSLLTARSEHVDVAMTEGPWTIEPVGIESVGTIDFTFANNGTATHRPIVVSLELPTDEVEARLQDGDTAAILDRLFQAPGATSPRVELGAAGHFHQGSDEQSELPDDAVVRGPVGDDILRYVYTDAVAAGERGDGSVSNKEAFEPGISFVVLCLDPEHGGRGEYAVLGVAESEQ